MEENQLNVQEEQRERKVVCQFVITKYDTDEYEYMIPEGMPAMTAEDIQVELDKLSPFNKDEIRKLAYIGASQGVLDLFKHYGLIKEKTEETDGNLSL